ncbi:MAG: hypothetical protein IIW48_13060 [Clostridia bacterium]|nr:hypothetical protein [Clostridia bacterium]
MNTNNTNPQPIYAQPITDKSQKSKGYAVIATALLAFPALVLPVVDYLGAPEWMLNLFSFFEYTPTFAQPGIISWSLYIIGILMCLWMVAVLPALKPKNPAVAASICCLVVSLYMVLLSFINNGALWYKAYVLPVCLMVTVTTSILTLLLSYGIIHKRHTFSAVAVQLALISIGSEIVSDINISGAVNLRRSLITAVVLAGVVIIYEAIRYASRINKQQ